MNDERDPSAPTPETLPYRRDGKGRRRVIRIVTIAAAVVCAILAAQLILPTLARPRDGNPRAYCASNLKQIGLGAIMYADSNGGRFPDDLETLVDNEDLCASVLMCPSSAGDVPIAPTTREVVSAMRRARLISYIYLGKGLRLDASPDTVLAYEGVVAHGDGMNVLFVDGHVDYLDGNGARIVLKLAAAGVSPIHYPVVSDSSTTQPSPGN